MVMSTSSPAGTSRDRPPAAHRGWARRRDGGGRAAVRASADPGGSQVFERQRSRGRRSASHRDNEPNRTTTSCRPGPTRIRTGRNIDSHWRRRPVDENLSGKVNPANSSHAGASTSVGAQPPVAVGGVQRRRQFARRQGAWPVPAGLLARRRAHRLPGRKAAQPTAVSIRSRPRCHASAMSASASSTSTARPGRPAPS